MKSVAERVDYASAPADYAEFVRIYRPIIVQLVRACGIEPDSVEDVAHDIMISLMKRDVIAEYDPNYVTVRKGVEYATTFKKFIADNVRTYCMGKRERQTQRRRREPVIIDAPSAPDDSTSWLDSHFLMDGHEESVCEQLAEKDTVSLWRSYLETVPRRRDDDGLDLVELFDAIVAQIRTQSGRRGRIDYNELGAGFNVSGTAIRTWVRLLKYHLAVIADRPMRPRSCR